MPFRMILSTAAVSLALTVSASAQTTDTNTARGAMPSDAVVSHKCPRGYVHSKRGHKCFRRRGSSSGSHSGR